MNKNWNDRADKDLFFTILSVKNIGVISGSEWTTIGNHMRSLGYGFTNEGCRQHFQGLRRAQHKAETNGTGGSDNPRKVDPTMNPITRRPGPGRGRPKKQPQQPAPMPIPPLLAQTGQADQPLQPNQPLQPVQPLQPGQPLQAGQPLQPSQSPQPGQPLQPSHSLEPNEAIPNDQHQHQHQQQSEHQPQPQNLMPDGLHALPESLDLPIKEDTLDISLKDDNDDEEQDGPDAKRIKLDNTPQDPSLVEDEAVLALAAHSEAPSVDAYDSEYPTAGLTGSDPHSFSYGGET
ncbi:Actin cytoskeleton-regulatory complex protein PAN1-like protein 1 [Colletotrichum chlorophyti]|uniref:Actin cytoskeleton-regulatory complex protein PAN1-like protein 1 n=1 Tax=Colletotrichum chlorophyti TaxID=708187 RepID=A0A1Q8RXU3_9PEZI|nr:Actin cytoskeleton-regulatory complex protein PAN1-like protein 1 [Colletotrichum chlorophyti]